MEIVIEGTRELSTAARVEQRLPPAVWAPYETRFTLDATCGANPPPCIDPSRPVHPRPWNPTCRRQCGLGCTGSTGATTSILRVVVTTCDGTASIASAPFDLGGSQTEAALERLWAVDAMTRAVAMRLEEPTSRWDAAAAPAAGKLAGFSVRSASSRPLEKDAQAALSVALGAPTGFDDATAKRCSVHLLVGFRVTRSLPTTGAEPKSQDIEIAIDFACQKIFVVRSTGASLIVHASHFDPSRAAFVALAKSALPDDPELARLR
jgi:hypothetical protein